MLDANLRGPFFVATSFTVHMMADSYGRINVWALSPASSNTRASYPYCARRDGIKQLTMSLADEWGARGVTANCLAPGLFKT